MEKRFLGVKILADQGLLNPSSAGARLGDVRKERQATPSGEQQCGQMGGMSI